MPCLRMWIHIVFFCFESEIFFFFFRSASVLIIVFEEEELIELGAS